ncbi:MAG: hypothetical protein OXG74_05645 [Acidobacteria bacterium]|nr:hypothetical protein [Acidobacteriota bacterium]
MVAPGYGEVGRRGTRFYRFPYGLLLRIPLAFAAFCVPLAAQEFESELPSELFLGDEIEVRVVNLEVVVENRAGERVTGLGPEDFRLLVDGSEVGIDFFTEIAGKRAVAGTGSDTPPSIRAAEIVPTNYVLFVDDDHTHVTSRSPSLRGFRDSLAMLPAGDHIAVVVQSRRQLEIVSPFTTDREATRTALREFDGGGRFEGFLRAGRRRPAESRDPSGSGDTASTGEVVSHRPVRAVIDSERAVVSASYVGSGSRGFADRWPNRGTGVMRPLIRGPVGDFGLAGMRSPHMLFTDLRFSVDAVVSTMRALEPPVGRKVLLLMAGSWPSGDFGLAGLGSGKQTDFHLLDALINTANLLGYTVYPVGGPRGGGGGWYVARGTGGRAFLWGTNEKVLEKVNDDTSHYYWMGFVPEYRRDDRVHKIRVKVKRPRLRVRSRRGYLDLSRGAEAETEVLRQLLFPAGAEEGGEPLLIAIGEPERAKRRRMSVPISVYLPVGRFPALPYDGRFLQELEVRFAAVDSLGRRSGTPMHRLRLGGSSVPAAEDVVLYRTVLALRRLPHDLVVTVHAPLSRLTASGRTRVVP